MINDYVFSDTVVDDKVVSHTDNRKYNIYTFKIYKITFYLKHQ